MSLLTAPKTARWPFLVGDVLLIGLAWFFYTQATLPFNGPTLFACVACIAIGAILGTTPFIMDYRAAVRLAESNGLASTVDQIRELETIATTVAGATGQWQSVHEHAKSAGDSARKVSEQMSAEMKSFMEFFEKANDSERQHLKLEVDKLKREESDWLGVLIRTLDHVFAIHTAASQAGQQTFVDQLSQLQVACRDAARRVGLTSLEASSGMVFDPEQHQSAAGDEVPEGSRIVRTVATGFTFRGQKVRPIIVELQAAEAEPAAPSPEQMPQAESDTLSEDTSSEQELSL